VQCQDEGGPEETENQPNNYGKRLLCNQIQIEWKRCDADGASPNVSNGRAELRSDLRL